jgi:hypothetical protein
MVKETKNRAQRRFEEKKARAKKQKPKLKLTRSHYRRLKLKLNMYEKFNFKMPRKGQDFTPRQKAILTRANNRLGESIQNIKQDRASFVYYPKGSKIPGTDGLRTKKGIFFKFPGAKAVKIKYIDASGRTRKKITIRISYKKMRELLLPFPPSILGDMDAIVDWIAEMEKIYKPDFIMWNVAGNKGRREFTPEAFNLYAFDLDPDDPQLNRAKEGLPFYIGVFFTWDPNTKL